MAKAGGNYLNSSLIKMDAVLGGFAEGIALTVDGLLSEGSGENLFVIRDGVIYTTPMSFAILPGITRDSILTLARESGYDVKEAAMPREILYVADELFFTGTAAEVTPIKTVDHHAIGEGRRGPITAELQEKYFAAIRDIDNAHGWLTFAREVAGASANGHAASVPA
jgi:branched-chain amino acid aminotransferase